MNFWLDFFRASSGSILRKRARFTAAKRMSPISDSMGSAGEAEADFSGVADLDLVGEVDADFVMELAEADCRASRSSADSSSSLAKMPPTESQSKPTRAALRVSWKPSRRA